MTKRTRTYISLVLLVLFLAFKVSITMFTHVHVIGGATIVHSHPYSDKNHPHSASQIITISHACSVMVVEPEWPHTIVVYRPVLYEVECDAGVYGVATVLVNISGLRAPPFYC